MKVTVLELPARAGAVDAMFAAVERELQQSPGDVTLLPEAALTGYLPDPSGLAEARGGPTEQRIAELSKKYGTTLVAPLIERDGASVYNTVTAPGLFHYRKRHPWYVEKWATPGDAGHPVVKLAGARVAVAICFDIHFIESLDCDVLLFPSAWVDEEDDARALLLPSVARRFGVFVVNANWGVGEPKVNGQGGSMVVAPDGKVLARGGPRLDVTLPLD